MPIVKLTGSEAWDAIYVICVDRRGVEKYEFNEQGRCVRLSDTVAALLASAAITDVIIAAHGLCNHGDKAVSCYKKWMEAMAMSTSAGLAALQHSRAAAFRPLLVGISWSSQPYAPPTGQECVKYVDDVVTAGVDATRSAAPVAIVAGGTAGLAATGGNFFGGAFGATLGAAGAVAKGGYKSVKAAFCGACLGGHVVLAALRGRPPTGGAPPPPRRAVDSVLLVQAAVPADCFTAGACYDGLLSPAVAGVVVVTRSASDKALAKRYRVCQPAPPPLGAAGATGDVPIWRTVLNAGSAVDGTTLRRGRVTDVDATAVIRLREDAYVENCLAGSHANILSDEVLDLLWAAVAAAVA
ncbi:hypothetical protein I4F81_000874 [Pyropia yezoensis]|uniref:Uncharacterized protein n=1 Tax=Pyropia yezoensis TaxID=2788 RepID=A0ACC3BKM7_PYRYE|nr:hypothetical protein I4F81_000874 [Neopyropia yezoensis]